MKSEHYDLIAIGAGSAARDGANKAAKDYGAKVALIEGEQWGGSCPNVACVPTKAYLVAADLAHSINTLAKERGFVPLIDLAAYGLGRVSCFHFSFSRLEFRLFEG